ncbi:MAG: polysaccharide biosynthesis tyrosine autokinase, partial [Bacteroidales bacterium]|nr:polysaccharide biosynthesis tyrosine autokinase [Bacteroidales bacterium]
MQESNSNDSVDLRELFYKCIAHWKWFVVSIVVCVSVAALKLASSNDIYESSASILIGSEDYASSARKVRDAFSLMGIGAMESNVHNEMLALGSPTLMTEVVKEMRLNEIYRIRQGLKTVELYKREPVFVVFENLTDLPKQLSMDIIIKSPSEFMLKNLHANNVDFDNEITVNTGNMVETPIGKLALSTSQYYSDDMVGKTIHYTRMDPELLTDSYLERLKINLASRDASVIDISFTDASVTKTLDFVTTLIDTYNKNWVFAQNAKIRSIAELVNDRIAVTVKELNDAEANISSYMSSTLVSNFDQASNAYFSQNLALNKEIMTYRTQVNIAKAMITSLSDSKSLTLPANSGLTDNNIGTQIQDYNRLILEYNKLVANSGPNNVIVTDMNKSLQAMREGILQSLDVFIKNTNLIISSLENQMSKSQKQLASTPQEALHLANVQREQKIKEELYLFLLEKKEENSLSLAFESDNSQIIVTPHSTLHPIGPNKRMIMLAALVIAFALPIALLWMRDTLDTSIHTKKDLDSLKASYLGEVPLVGKKKHRKYLPKWLQELPWKKEEEKFIVRVKKNSRNIINESFRILRSNLDFMNKAGDNKVFMLTSLNPGSGKSFISMNLSASYALKGSKVLVIDMDMRRATASKYATSDKHTKGLADYLSGADNDYKKIVLKEPIMHGMDVLPVGTIPPNPAELVLSDRLSTMIAELRKEYDYIFLDCPPLDIVSESNEIAKYADMAIFVVRAGLFEKAMLPEIDKIYTKKLFNNMVVVLNAVTKAGHYGYGYG